MLYGFGCILLEPFFTSSKSLCSTCFCFPELRLEEQRVLVVPADMDHQADNSLHASPSLLGILKEAGGDTVVESEVGEVQQVPRHRDSMSGVGGQFPMRPSLFVASA